MYIIYFDFHSFPHSFISSLIHSLLRLILPHSFHLSFALPHSFPRSFTLSLTPSLTSLSLTHSLTRSPSHSLTPSLTLSNHANNLASRISNYIQKSDHIGFSRLWPKQQRWRGYMDLLHSRSYQNSSSKQEYNRSGLPPPSEFSIHSNRPEQVVGNGQKNLIC